MNCKIGHLILAAVAGAALSHRAQAFPAYNGDYDGKTIVSFSSGGDDYKSVVPTVGHAISNFLAHYFSFQILPNKKATGDMQLYVSGAAGYYYSEYGFTAATMSKPGKPKKKKKKKMQISSTGAAGDKAGGSVFSLNGLFNDKPTVVTGTVGPGKKGALEVDLKIRPKKPKKLGYDGNVRVHFIGKLKQ